MLVKIGAYLLGEFGHLVADSPGCSPIEQFMALQSKMPGCSFSTRAIILSSFVKFNQLVSRNQATTAPCLQNLQPQLRFGTSTESLRIPCAGNHANRRSAFKQFVMRCLRSQNGRRLYCHDYIPSMQQPAIRGHGLLAVGMRMPDPKEMLLVQQTGSQKVLHERFSNTNSCARELGLLMDLATLMAILHSGLNDLGWS